MHAWQFAAFADDFRFLRGQLVQPDANGFPRREVLGQFHIRRVVTRLTFKQARVKIGQFGVAISNMIAEQTESHKTCSCLVGSSERANQH